MFKIFRKAQLSPLPATIAEDTPSIAPGSPPAREIASASQLSPWPPEAVAARPGGVPAHPLADLFPLIEGEAFDALVASIKREGQHDPITLHPDGRILDGRNRYRACLAAGVEPICEEYAETDPVKLAQWVAAKNMQRRHLTDGQRVLIAVELTEKWGVTVGTAAKQMAISTRSVRRARVVIADGSSNVVQLMRHGKISPAAAYEEVKNRRKASGQAHQIKAPAADRALAKAFDMIEKALASGEPISADMRRRAASIGAQLSKFGREAAA